MTKIHVEGMGWFGAITTLALERAGIDFTWSDIETPVQAWRASTGIVYPAGDHLSQDNHRRWAEWLAEGWLPVDTVERVPYGFAHKSPPHEGNYRIAADFGWLRVGSIPAYAVNVQAIVAEARSRFAIHHTGGPSPDQSVIVAHGHARSAGWVWGWSRKVSLIMPPELTGESYGRTVLYGKTHRFALTYAYPVAGEPDWWYAGSALVNQTRPAPRDEAAVTKEWRRWWEDFHELFPGVGFARRMGPIIQGWRPKPRRDTQPSMEYQYHPSTGEPVGIRFPALWHSGVRWAPDLVLRAGLWARAMVDR